MENLTDETAASNFIPSPLMPKVTTPTSTFDIDKGSGAAAASPHCAMLCCAESFPRQKQSPWNSTHQSMARGQP